MSMRTLTILSLLLAASAWPGTAVVSSAQSQESVESVHVAVENRNASDVRVYVLLEGHMAPAGLVPGAGAATLTVPPFFARSDEPIRLVLDELAGSGWTRTDPVDIDPGSEITLTIESDLPGSTVSTGQEA